MGNRSTRSKGIHIDNKVHTKCHLAGSSVIGDNESVQCQGYGLEGCTFCDRPQRRAVLNFWYRRLRTHRHVIKAIISINTWRVTPPRDGYTNFGLTEWKLLWSDRVAFVFLITPMRSGTKWIAWTSKKDWLGRGVRGEEVILARLL